MVDMTGKKLISPKTKWPPFRRWYFQMHFHEWKFFDSFQISPKFVPEGPIDNKSALVQVMACRLFGAKPLPEPRLPYIYDTRGRFKTVLPMCLEHFRVTEKLNISISCLWDLTRYFDNGVFGDIWMTFKGFEIRTWGQRCLVICTLPPAATVFHCLWVWSGVCGWGGI